MGTTTEKQELPRPEYPRPQFVRREWANLNGEWEFSFDDADQGLRDGWGDGRELERRITVPFAYQCEASGVNDKGIHEVVWYARSFETPATWRGQDVLLQFGAVDYRTTVWVNGREIGHNRGGHVPFAFNIGPYLTEGENRLTVRVEDRQDPSQPRGKQSHSGLPRGIDYFCTTGIWQTVWLEPVPPLRIDTVQVTPTEADSFDVTAFLHAPSTGWRVEVEVRAGKTIVGQESVETDGAVAQLSVSIPWAKRWTTETPHLYMLHVRLFQNGTLLDEIGTYAGMRTVRVRDGQVLLNGEPVFLAMVMDQGYWPEGYLTAPTDAALRADVEWMKRLGFNGARKHQKIEDPRWLYWCDRLGMLVWGEMPNARAWSSEAEERLLAEWERAVERDVNHPCVVAWVPVNESMGFPALKESHPGQYAFLERIVAATRRLDPYRPVIDNDGWEHTDVTDICAIHDYTKTGDGIRERYRRTEQEGPFPPTIWAGTRSIFVRGSRWRGQPVVLSEVGGFLEIPAEVAAEKRDGLYKVYGSFSTEEELLAMYGDLMQALAELPFLAGFCYTQLTDIEQEKNGLLTFDRRPKVEPERLAEIHRRLFLEREVGSRLNDPTSRDRSLHP